MSYLELRDGTRIRYTIRGDGPSVVLVHGWKQSHRLFDQAIHRLSDQFRVLAFDQRGTGESDKPERDYGFSTLAQDLNEVLDLCDATEATAIGWSMGCTTVLSALDIGSPRISRVLLMNGPLRLLGSPDFPFGLSQDRLNGYIEGLSENWPLDQRKFLADSLLPENQGLLPLLEHVAWQTPLPIALDLVRNQALIDHTETVRQLQIPILAAYSPKDPYWPIELAYWIEKNAPHARVHTFMKSAHCPPLEEPAEFARVVAEFSREVVHA